MKKHALIITVLAFSFALTSAQTRFQLGLKAGYNSTSFETGEEQSFFQDKPNYTFQNAKDDFRSGYHIGAYSRIGLFGNLSLQPELYYAKKTGQTEFQFTESIGYKENISFHTWDIPILAHLRILDLRVVNLYGLAGPVASFKANDRSSLSSLSEDVWDNDRLNEINWNFQAGAGVEFLRFNFDIRYEWGLNDVSKTELDRKSRSLMFSLGYRLIGF